jgi:hypothetical protein
MSRISSSASPLSFRMNLELALCCRPAHHGQAQYGLPRATDDGTLAPHPQYQEQGYMFEGLQTEPLQEPDRYSCPGTSRMSTSSTGLRIWRPPDATFATNPTRKESGTSHWSAVTPWMRTSSYHLCMRSDQSTTTITRHSALGMTSTKLQRNLSIHRRTIAMATAGFQS